MGRHWSTTVRSLLFEVSEFMARTLRHDASIPREEDGAVRFDDLINRWKAEFGYTLRWTVKTWANSLTQGGGEKKRFQYCLDPYILNKILYFRAVQGHSGENFDDPLLQDNTLLPDEFAECIHHIGNAFEMHSVIKSGPINPRKKPQKGQAVSVLHSREPDVCSTRSGRSWIRSGQTQNQTVKTHKESSSQYSFFGAI